MDCDHAGLIQTRWLIPVVGAIALAVLMGTPPESGPPVRMGEVSASAVAAVGVLLASPSAPTRRAAIHRLADAPGMASLAVLADHASRGEPEVATRRELALAIRRAGRGAGEAQAAQLLADLFGRERDASVRAAILLAFSTIAGHPDSDHAALGSMLKAASLSHEAAKIVELRARRSVTPPSSSTTATMTSAPDAR